MEENQIHDDLASIRSLMERSSKFLSLSGLSGILAGIYALIGAWVAHYLIYDAFGPINRIYRVNPDHFSTQAKGFSYGNPHLISEFFHMRLPALIVDLLIVATLVFVLSVLTGIILTLRKARRKGLTFWGNTSKLLLFNMIVPLIAGGLLCVILISRGDYAIVAPATLIFYGLALTGAGNFTFTDVKYLGITEIILGLIAALYPGYGLLFWTIGFGILHIVYGGMMYIKYDR